MPNGVPKRMKKLARMYYGRTVSYANALEQGEGAALAAALARNVRPDASEWPEAAALAGYVQEAYRMLAGLGVEEIRDGRIAFPEPEAG